MNTDTIYALSSGTGRAGVSVFRVSGPQAALAVERLTGAPPPRPRMADLRRIVDPLDGAPIDRGLILWFASPASFSGEDVAEFHIHGGVAVASALTDALAAIPGCRLAEAGEFTRRAFRNGKLDLAEAEGIADLIDADTAAARRQALWQLEGGLSARYGAWAAQLLDIRALAEAALDFSDEPIPDEIEAEALRSIRALLDEFNAALQAPAVGERLRDGLRVALIGAPNAGKSSLMNAIAGRDVSIVTHVAGTTRDIIEVKLDLAGYPVVLLDTAGLRETSNLVEQEGVRRARAAAAAADVIIEVVDLTDPTFRLPKDDLTPDAAQIRFNNKADVAGLTLVSSDDQLVGAAKLGIGVDSLIDRLTEYAQSFMQGEPQVITRARHRAALADAVAALERAIAADAPELAAEDLRSASAALGRVTGVLDVEDVLDKIFGAFCIGK